MLLCKFLRALTLKNKSTTTLLTLQRFFYVFYVYFENFFLSCCHKKNGFAIKMCLRNLQVRKSFRKLVSFNSCLTIIQAGNARRWIECQRERENWENQVESERGSTLKTWVRAVVLSRHVKNFSGSSLRKRINLQPSCNTVTMLHAAGINIPRFVWAAKQVRCLASGK